MFYSADEGAVNVTRLNRENPGRRKVSVEEEEELQTMCDESLELVDEILEDLESSEDESEIGEEESSEPQSSLPKPLARQINIPADRPINAKQLSNIAETNEWFQRLEAEEMACLDSQLDLDMIASFENQESFLTSPDVAHGTDQTGQRKLTTSVIRGGPGIDSQRPITARPMDHNMDKAQLAKMKRAALRQDIQRQDFIPRKSVL